MIPIFYHHHTSHFDSEVVGNQNHLKKEHAAPVEDKPARWYRDFFIQRSQKDKKFGIALSSCLQNMFFQYLKTMLQSLFTLPQQQKKKVAKHISTWNDAGKPWKHSATSIYFLSYGIHDMQLR